MIKNKVIAIDFDGTITDYSPFPKTGELRKDAVKYIKLLYEKGYKLILWTARTGMYYTECLDLLNEWGLLKYIDTNYTYSREYGKIYADFYVDDKSILVKIKWKKIYKYIIKNIKEKK